jgi:hypothetical protein
MIVVPIVLGALVVKALCASEASGTSNSATWRHIPEDGNLQKRRCEKRRFRTLLATLVGHSPASQPASLFATHTSSTHPTPRNLDYRMDFVQKNSDMDQIAARGRSGFIHVLWFLFFVK